MGKLKSYGYLIEITPFEGLKDINLLTKEYEKRFCEKTLRLKGQQDGKKNIPDAESKAPSQFEKELLHVTARLSRSIGGIFRSALEQLDGKIKAEECLITSKRKNHLERIEANYEAEKHGAEDAFGLQQSHKELGETDRAFQSMREKYGRAPVTYIPT